MIDFRYHLVSLISVFLALAVGIVLGAGPLKEAIGDTLSGEVDALRERASDLRTELDETQVALGLSEEAFATVAPDLLDGVMPGRRVAVVTVGSVAPGVVEAVGERIRQSGAEVTASVQITEAWADPARRAYRQSLAATLVEYLDPVPPQDAGTGAELAEALTQSLTTADPADPDGFSQDARIVLDVLVEAELVTLQGEVTMPADAFVVLVEPAVVAEPPAEGATAEPVDPDEAERREEVIVTSMQIATVAQARSRGAVVGSGEVVEGGLLERLRNANLNSRVSTVEAVDTVVGQVSVVLALSARMGGPPGHYGPSESATQLVPPRVVHPPFDRVPEVPEEGLDDGTGSVEEGTDAVAGGADGTAAEVETSG